MRSNTTAHVLTSESSRKRAHAKFAKVALGPTQPIQLIIGEYQGPHFSEKLHALDVISTASDIERDGPTELHSLLTVSTLSSTAVLRDPAYAEENAKARVKALNGRVIPTIGIVAQTLSSDWLVEIEVIAAA